MQPDRDDGDRLQAGCGAVADDLATDNALNGNGKSHPVARLHEILKHHDGGENVCAQCGAGNDLGSYKTASGETVLLHEECVHFWEDEFWRKPGEALDIPDFLKREPLTDEAIDGED